ncbi:MAG: TatD family hydrolase [Nitrospira sp. BO4]|jgi:TatD DNase family protein|nr:TatD family hydrolase [Nitrospira sp. BO4]
MITNLVDFHCHLDLYPDFESLISECELKGIHTLTVTTTPKAWPRNRNLASVTKHIRVALGLHPQLVSERAHEFELWKEYLPQARYVGEVGLDAGPNFYKSFDLQKQVFEKILKQCSLAGEKILTVHSLRAAPTVLDMIEAHLSQNTCKVVLHWFTGGPKQAKRAIDLGCYFSINAEMLKSDRHHALLKEIPIARILTETDGPFTQSKGRPSRPSDVQDVLHNLSRIMGLDVEFLTQQILRNLEQLEN